MQELFTEVTMFRQLQRKGWKNFVFRAACKRGADVDLVPLVVQLSEPGPTPQPFTLWAKVAPPRQVNCKQRQIKGGAIPFFDKTSILDPVQVSTTAPQNHEPPTATAQDDSKEPPPAPKRIRTKGTTLRPQPRDGDCLYHSFSAALKWLTKRKDYEAPHPHELRARMVDHLKRYEDQYRIHWESAGKIGPTGDALDKWETFLSQVSKPGAYAGEAELRALCRIYDVRIIIVPEDANFHVCAYHRKASKKRTAAIFYTDKHFDFLEPDDKSYPSDILDINVDPTGGFLVGGDPAASDGGTVFTKSTAKRSSSSIVASTTWTRPTSPAKRGSTKVSTGPATTKRARPIKSQRGSIMSEVAPVIVAEDPDGERQTSTPTPAQLRMRRIVYNKLPASGLFKCSLCAFVRKANNQAQYSEIRYRHSMQYHNGAGLPGRAKRKQVISKVEAGKSYAWRCNFCDQGILSGVRAQISKGTLKDVKRKHRRAAHPRVTDKVWQKANNCSRQATRILSINRFAAAKCRDDMELIKKGHSKFSWPLAKRPPKSKTIIGIMVLGAWKCGICGGCDRPKEILVHGDNPRCNPDNARKNSVIRLKELRRLQKWGKANPRKHDIPEEMFDSIFTGAESALTVSLPAQPSSA